MNWYRRLSALGFKQSYALKFSIVAFLGIHLPLIVMIVYLVVSHQLVTSALPLGILILLATLVGTAATLYIQYQLLEPVRLAEKALSAYTQNQVLPNLPAGSDDEAGRLLASVQSSLVRLDKVLGEKEKIMTSLSRDLRSPLSSIASAVEMVAQSESNPDNRHLLELIKEAADRELSQINDVLVAASIGQNQLELRTTLVDVKTIVSEVYRNARSVSQQRAIEFQMETPSEQIYVTADRARLLQVLNNLVSNALKFTHASGTVCLKAELQGSKCRFSVQDTGVGMTQEQQAAIAQYFRSPKDGDAQAWDGWLGLWICSHLVRLHGGEILVKSQAGQGTAISFELDSSH